MLTPAAATRRGALVARTLRGAWRPTPPPLRLSAAELVQIAPLLLASGGGALGWWRVRGSALATHSAAAELRQTYLLYTVRAAAAEASLADALRALRGAGIEPLLAKGWAVAHLYAAPGLRPYGDLDLYVAPHHKEAAERALAALPRHTVLYDVQQGAGLELAERPFAALQARARPASVGGQTVCVMAPEDHLRLLCLHALRHGLPRPLWLCDIAALLEALPPGFDWAACLRGADWQADWVRCLLLLAVRLLRARPDALPPVLRAGPLPHWLPAAVLRGWGRPMAPIYRLPPIRRALRHPLILPAALAARWPSPLAAAYQLQWAPSPLIHPLLLQAAAYTGRAVARVRRPPAQ